MQCLTPSEIVGELDRYIIGQNEAKRSVAIALRNRWRRQQVEPEFADEIYPKNIIMIGPTGVGKTEIARRLATIAAAPFIKVEASRYTEVGYHGRDVESIVRDLVEIGIKLVMDEYRAGAREQAERAAEERLVNLLLPLPTIGGDEEHAAKREKTRAKIVKKLRDGEFDDQDVEITVEEKKGPLVQMAGANIYDEMGVDIQALMEQFAPTTQVAKTVKVSHARRIIVEQETERLLDHERINGEAIARVEQSGIVFIDEIDKIASSGSTHGPDVSRQGVQRDLLPIVEGTNIRTRHGYVKTDHILFIGAGAFHTARPSDLIPELQGRFPIRVELKSLTRDDFVRILTEPENSLVRQYTVLMRTEGVKLVFRPDAIEKIAQIACTVNTDTENIGARRLHAVIEKLLDDLSFNAPTMQGVEVEITAEYVDERLREIYRNADLSKYIL